MERYGAVDLGAGACEQSHEWRYEKVTEELKANQEIEKLEKRMDELGLKKEDYDFYLDLRKYGSTRHSGFGLGFERCVMYLTGMGNIRDVIPFPRTVKNCDL